MSAVTDWTENPDPIYEAAQKAVAELAEGVPDWLITVAVNAAFAAADTCTEIERLRRELNRISRVLDAVADDIGEEYLEHLEIDA